MLNEKNNYNNINASDENNAYLKVIENLSKCKIELNTLYEEILRTNYKSLIDNGFNITKDKLLVDIRTEISRQKEESKDIVMPESLKNYMDIVLSTNKGFLTEKEDLINEIIECMQQNDEFSYIGLERAGIFEPTKNKLKTKSIDNLKTILARYK